jgi:hypothetical protein
MGTQQEARWDIMKHETGKLYVTEELQSRHHKECKTKHPNTIANFFNDFFLIITKNPNRRQTIVHQI